MHVEKAGNGSISTVKQSRPFEAYPELVEVIRLLEMHDSNPIWIGKLRNEIDGALATERNASYQKGYEHGRADEADTVAACLV